MSRSLRKSVNLYYDVVSPYSWIAFELLDRYKHAWNIHLKLKPFSLTEVLYKTGNSCPGKNSPVFKYQCRDVEELGKHYKLPLNIPSNVHTKMYQKGSLPAMRLLTAVNQLEPDMTENLSRSLWSSMWSKDQDITQRKTLIQAGTAIGQSERVMEHLLTKTKERSIKDRLKETTQEAIDLGAFGAPTITAEDDKQETHLLCGSDRMHILADILGIKESKESETSTHSPSGDLEQLSVAL